MAAQELRTAIRGDLWVGELAAPPPQGEKMNDEHPCAGPTSNFGPWRENGPFCNVECPKCKATCQENPATAHVVHTGYFAGHFHTWKDN